MNRSERRRELKSKTKRPTYNMNVDQINELKRQTIDESVDKLILLMLGLPTLVLKDKWGFGNKRLEKFTDEVLKMYDAYCTGHISLEEIKEVLWIEAGIKLED